jgi:DNA mismatch repair protein MutS2
MELPGALCAAMEFDPDTGEPRYRLLPGPPGGSEALARARRLGLARELLGRAEARLTREGRDYRRLLAEVERLRRDLARRLGEAEAEARGAEEERGRLERERAALEAERRTTGKRLERELAEFRRQVRAQLAGEVEKLKVQHAGGRRRGLAEEATRQLFESAPVAPAVAEPEPEAPVAVGGRVRHRSLGWQGVLERLERGRAEVTVEGKRLRCRAEDLVGLPARVIAAGSRGAPGDVPRGTVRPRPAVRVPERESAPPELMLIGQRVEGALDRLDAYLDDALLAGREEVRVVHGHGTGRLRDAVRQHLRAHPEVAAVRPGVEGEGGNGATVVRLRG